MRKSVKHVRFFEKFKATLWLLQKNKYSSNPLLLPQTPESSEESTQMTAAAINNPIVTPQQTFAQQNYQFVTQQPQQAVSVNAISW